MHLWHPLHCPLFDIPLWLPMPELFPSAPWCLCVIGKVPFALLSVWEAVVLIFGVWKFSGQGRVGLHPVWDRIICFVLPLAFFLWSLAGTSLGSIGEAFPILREQQGGKQQTVPRFSVEVGKKKYPNPIVSFNRDYSVYQVDNLRSHHHIAFHLYGNIHTKGT